MDYHTPFMTGELAEDTGIRVDAATLDDDAPVVTVNGQGNLLGEQNECLGRLPESGHGG